MLKLSVELQILSVNNAVLLTIQAVGTNDANVQRKKNAVQTAPLELIEKIIHFDSATFAGAQRKIQSRCREERPEKTPIPNRI